MGISDHLTCLLRNLYAGQEAAVRTQHGTTDWFKIGKGVRQGCILSPCLVLVSASESRSVVSDFFQPHRLYSPWNSPGQNTGVPNRGIEPGSPTSQVDSLPAETPGKPLLLNLYVEYIMQNAG